MIVLLTIGWIRTIIDLFIVRSTLAVCVSCRMKHHHPPPPPPSLSYLCVLVSKRLSLSSVDRLQPPRDRQRIECHKEKETYTEKRLK